MLCMEQDTKTVGSQNTAPCGEINFSRFVRCPAPTEIHMKIQVNSDKTISVDSTLAGTLEADVSRVLSKFAKK